jgi:predicted metal-dependent phosphoesterase TrpH
MKPDLLLCELHAHTTWSDGVLTVTELVDLYGRHSFDVLCITDHAAPGGVGRLNAATYARYLEAIEREARRAREQYDLLLIPGMELTFHGGGPEHAGHALALGLRSWVDLDRGLRDAVREARAGGAALVAAHPHGEGSDPNPHRTTRWFWNNRSRLRGLVHRFELINRDQTFAWIADSGLRGVASGDFHRPEHLETWKTQLPCAKTERAVVAYLRSRSPAYIVPWHLRDASQERRAA